MALTPGTRLGPYEVTAQIGVGGMGEVYRARDTKLNRDVALKVLPDSFANDPDRLARFAREAQTLASLNHPNIAAIYGLEEASYVGRDFSVRPRDILNGWDQDMVNGSGYGLSWEETQCPGWRPMCESNESGS